MTEVAPVEQTPPHVHCIQLGCGGNSVKHSATTSCWLFLAGPTHISAYPHDLQGPSLHAHYSMSMHQ
jgi:hypothetical protein